jgi:SpoVK/Ycf46/Vps4 family AAA+-type ATPase
VGVALSKPIPVEKESRFSLADKTHPTIEQIAIFLSDEVGVEVQSFIQSIKQQAQLAELGVPINPSLLVYGAPGTGKSLLATYIAASLNLPLVTARADSLISSYLGSTAKNIRALLEYAQTEPCVLFLDEFDAIAKARDDKNEVGELKRVVVSLLQNIDNLGDTVVIAATNHPHLLDPAIWRRFHCKLELKAPTEQVRGSILSTLLNRLQIHPKDLKLLIAFSKQLTGAEIEMATYDYLRFMVINSVDFDAYALIKRFLGYRYRGISFDKDKRAENIVVLKATDPDLFTYRMLAHLFGISSSYVGKIIKENAQ